MQYIIESRELTSAARQPAMLDPVPSRVRLEAVDADEAISQFVRDGEAELVSLTRPSRGSESIATIRKNDAVFLVRVYTD